MVADALSRMDAGPAIVESLDLEPIDIRSQIAACTLAQLTRNEATLPSLTRENNERFIINHLMASNETISEKFPMSPALISKYQKKDRELQKKIKNNPNNYGTKEVENITLNTARQHNNAIIVPKVLQNRIVAWYHEYLVHPGGTRLEKTLTQLFWWDNLPKDVERYVRTCRKCQQCKQTTAKKYGLLPPKEAEPAVPWQRVNLDMIGPLTVRQPTGKSLQLQALTMIDPATGWFEIKDVAKIDSDCCSQAFDDTWLCRYPRPQYLGFDGGKEFKLLFDEMRENYGMTKKLSSPYNPQANGIIERIHQVINDMLRTFELEEQQLDPQEPWSRILSAVAFAVHSTYHTTLEATPAQLIFGRDMLLPVQFQADWAQIRMRRQAAINKNNFKENKSRIPHHYQVGDLVMIKHQGTRRKLSSPFSEPYPVERVYNNGTLLIRKGPVAKRLNMRLCTPYNE